MTTLIEDVIWPIITPKGVGLFKVLQIIIENRTGVLVLDSQIETTLNEVGLEFTYLGSFDGIRLDVYEHFISWHDLETAASKLQIKGVL